MVISEAERRFGVPGITIRGWVNAGRVQITSAKPTRVTVESMAAADEYYNRLNGEQTS